jgi:hypothetical protein
LDIVQKAGPNVVLIESDISEGKASFAKIYEQGKPCPPQRLFYTRRKEEHTEIKDPQS